MQDLVWLYEFNPSEFEKFIEKMREALSTENKSASALKPDIEAIEKTMSMKRAMTYQLCSHVDCE